MLRTKKDDELSGKKEGHIAKRYRVDTCPGCLKQHFLPAYDPRFQTGLNPNCQKSGIFKYRSVYCPYQIPDNMVLSTSHRRHIDLCGNSSEHLERAPEAPTQIKTSSKKYYIFSKHEATVDHRYTGYFDLETFNTELHPSCFECTELMEISRCRKKKEVKFFEYFKFR